MGRRTGQWKTANQFNATYQGDPPTFTDTQVVGSGSSASVQLDTETDNDDDVAYDDVAKYTLSDSAKITVDQSNNNKASLKLLGGTSETWPFTTAGNYTYDSNKITVDGGKAALLGLSLTDVTFHANYNNDIDGTLGDGDLTGTASGGASVSSGKLDLAHSDTRYVTYDADLNADSQQVGCYRFLYTPNYTGSPAASQVIVRTSEESGSNNNEMSVFHTNTGDLKCNQRDSSGSTEVSFGAAWSPTSGVEYEIELNYDITTGNCRIFVDGTLHSSDLVTTGTRSSAIGEIRIGTNRTATLISNFKLDNLIIFDAVQHTSNYTAGASPVEFSTEDPDIVNNTGHAFTTAMDTFTETATKPTDTGIQYQVSSDNGTTWKYWGGSSWDTITAAQTDSWYYTNESNTAATVNTNIGSLASSGTFKFKAFLHTSDSDVTPELDSVYVAEPLTYSTTDNLYIDTKDTAQISPSIVLSYLSATITSSEPANTDIKIMLSTDGRSSWLTWSGSAWVAPASATTRTDGTSVSDVQTNITSLPAGDETLDVRLFLYSSASSASPDVSNINVTSLSGYKTSGEYLSTSYVPFELSEGGLLIKEITFDVTTPSGTSCVIKADFLQTNILDPRNSGFVTYSSGDVINITDARWIQWKAEMTGDGTVTPEVDYVEITFYTLLGITERIRKISDIQLIIDL